MSGAGGAGCLYPIMLVWPQEESKMEIKIHRKSDFFTALGVGIVIEGLIGFAIFLIS